MDNWTPLIDQTSAAPYVPNPNAEPTAQNCPYCGFLYHAASLCPMVQALEYYPTGSIKRVELVRQEAPAGFKPLDTEWQWAALIPTPRSVCLTFRRRRGRRSTSAPLWRPAAQIHRRLPADRARALSRRMGDTPWISQ